MGLYLACVGSSQEWDEVEGGARGKEREGRSGEGKERGSRERAVERGRVRGRGREGKSKRAKLGGGGNEQRGDHIYVDWV